MPKGKGRPTKRGLPEKGVVRKKLGRGLVRYKGKLVPKPKARRKKK